MQGQLSNWMGDQCCYTLQGRMEVLVRSIYKLKGNVFYNFYLTNTEKWNLEPHACYIFCESHLRFINKVICSQLLDEYNFIFLLFRVSHPFSRLTFFSPSPTLFPPVLIYTFLIKEDEHGNGVNMDLMNWWF